MTGPFSYCPRCGAEYRPGFTSCADCGVALVDAPPARLPADEEHGEHFEEGEHFEGPIVELTRRSSRFEADVIIAKLRSAGIAVSMDAADAGGWYPHLGFAQGYRVLVAEKDLDDARQAITLHERAWRVRRRRRPSA